MLAVVREEMLQRIFDQRLIFGIAERAPHQHAGTVADVGGDDLLGERIAAELGEHGVDGISEILARIDQRAIQVEDDEADFVGWNGIEQMQHALSLMCRLGNSVCRPLRYASVHAENRRMHAPGSRLPRFALARSCDGRRSFPFQ